jgi:pimeloyl-ACP methyl ester carboxylesterase
VCLHSNASTSGQWRGLIQLLAPSFRVLAPDLYDAGNGPRWPSKRIIHLRDEADLIEAVLERAGPTVALVGHSYGAAVALIAALANPRRVRALVLYEPPLFSFLDPETEEAHEIEDALGGATNALDAGSLDVAAERFLDYWGGTGTWEHTPEERKPPIAESMTNVRRWAYALFEEHRAVLHSRGSSSGAPSCERPAQVELVELENVGHMGPITHPEVVNNVVSRFLERHRRGSQVG